MLLSGDTVGTVSTLHGVCFIGEYSPWLCGTYSLSVKVPFAGTSTDLTPGKSSTESSMAHTVGEEAFPAGSYTEAYRRQRRIAPCQCVYLQCHSRGKR